ncbi:SMP-30/gluconolactonase/LRE family protein [Leifsonia sp. AG29]|uniref:SMP-30/gluconolactonase/LRE family protein n=1 Tax=Leifsonia sp. AG29 TaxID=2598860 RepID=UPI00131DD88F|nr:SMP-30/gluconolactonase/LRE family protein [Leifsonia sp. AG29]
MKAQVYARGSALLGEGPRLLPGRTDPWWVDLLRGTVLRRDPSGEAAAVAHFDGETASALLPLRTGETAVALRQRIAVIDASGAETRSVPVDEVPPTHRFSDATAGPSGHLWLGVVADGASTADGFLLRRGPDGTIVALDHVGFSNGLGFSRDGQRLFHIDSAAATISVIEHDPATGELGAARTLYRHPAGEPGELDGLAVDEHDRVWVAVFGGGVVLCVDQDGAVVHRVSVPAQRVSSCGFGTGEELYITTARVDADDDELIRQPDAGSVFVCSPCCGGGPVWEGTLTP